MIAITYIGHATTLIESNGSAVLTDPNFSKYVLCLKRVRPLPYDPAALPELSAVVISHAHYDHLDLNSFKYIKGTVPVFVPEGLGKYLSKFVRNPIVELKQWSSHKLPNGTEITATQAQHVGFRWTGFRYRTCNSYVIATGGQRIFFAGDTGYGPHFKDIGQFFGMTNPIDIAILPIGGYSPRWFMKKRHMNPAEALEAFLDLKAKHMIPIHYGEFKLSSEKVGEPAEWLERLATERNLSEQVHILNSGEKFTF